MTMLPGDPYLAPGTPRATWGTVDLQCPECGFVWFALGTFELGTFAPEDPSELFCPSCDTDGERI